MKLVQTLLRQDNIEMVCWLAHDSRVRIGTFISLEKVDGRWQVIRQYHRVEPDQIKRGWNNNI
jgi:hypothetical protein